jgi:hypothetical protein
MAILTVPFVAFGAFRFIGITKARPSRNAPDSMLRDTPFMSNPLAYAVALRDLVGAGR